MVFYKDNKWQICPKLAEYRAYGKLKRTYTDNPKWWQEFVNKWWHHEGLILHEVQPTQAQIDRLEVCNVAGIDEGFKGAVADYVESGIVSELLPDSFTQQIDITNSNKLWEYEQLTAEHIQAEVDRYNKQYGTAFTDVHSCANYAGKTDYTHYQFCSSVWDWSISVWEAARQILTDVQTEVIEPPDADTFISMLPAYGV